MYSSVRVDYESARGCKNKPLVKVIFGFVPYSEPTV